MRREQNWKDAHTTWIRSAALHSGSLAALATKRGLLLHVLRIYTLGFHQFKI